jgi:SNF2 family DNA or RNA helicase
MKTKTCGGCRQTLKAASSSFLVVACGHFLCSECRSAESFYCPVKDCSAFIRKRPVLRCSQVPRPTRSKPATKADCVADLIKNGIPSSEYVVVFAQYRPLVTALEKSFKEAGLQCLNLAAVNDKLIAGSLEAFKAGNAGQILLLDMDSETSAGSNLTIATHVIFANPYVHADEEHQARTVRQARGRCIRTGQTKKVHVYHFMVSGTVEEETLRKFGETSPAVQAYFDNCDCIPWWLDGGDAGGDKDTCEAK